MRLKNSLCRHSKLGSFLNSHRHLYLRPCPCHRLHHRLANVNDGRLLHVGCRHACTPTLGMRWGPNHAIGYCHLVTYQVHLLPSAQHSFIVFRALPMHVLLLSTMIRNTPFAPWWSLPSTPLAPSFAACRSTPWWASRITLLFIEDRACVGNRM